jgi:hypothetical protein
MSVLLATRCRLPDVRIVETHPKVLYWSLANRKHDYQATRDEMESMLCEVCALTLKTANEHEWDAALSALAAARGVLGEWTTDLHALPTRSGERLINPCGRTNYYWPDS